MRNSYDLLVVGTGVAGLYGALNADPKFSVLLVTKDEPLICNTALAQGGIAACLDRSEGNIEGHIRDTMVAGGGTNRRDAVEVLVREGPSDVEAIMRLGVEFDIDTLGKLHMTLEGGHSRRRIVHHRDTTGYEVAQKLYARVLERPNIHVLTQTTVLQLLRAGEGFAAGLLNDDGYTAMSARFCLLATGGIGRVYAYTTNARTATCDGIFHADTLGARIERLSLIQFHPTAFAAKPERERFLISEAVRGEGALLLNCNGERFMPHYDPRGELAPRDVVSHFIMEEQKRTGSDRFYLDITARGGDFIRDRFPSIYRNCLDQGIDITRERIPVYPCQHYVMGGIDVDLFGRTSVPGLYAAGECSHTGVHGNNRLASNSLLEALVFSRRAVTDMAGRAQPALPAVPVLHRQDGAPHREGLRRELRGIMQRSFFVSPNMAEVRKNLPRVQELDEELASPALAWTKDWLETRSLARAARIILTELQTAPAAPEASREESRPQ